MSELHTTTGATRPTTLNNTTDVGKSYFETDTNNIVVWDGAKWRGYANDGIAIGGSSYSLLLDGTDDRVELNSGLSVLNSAANFSISAWVKLDTDATLAAYFFQSGVSTSATGGVALYQANASFDFVIGHPGNTLYSGKRWSSNIKDGSWHHIAGVKNGSTLTFYLDKAVPTQSSIGSAVPSTTASSAGNSPHIGSRVDDNNEVKGRMDDLAIFDDALTATEIANIYDNALYPASKLKHLYKFENNFNDSIGSINGTAQSNAQTDNTNARP